MHAKQKICIVFEGRDGAGKGGVIKAITERVSPRVFHIVALSAPTEREQSQMYIQRYVPHLPAAGEVMIFDRSWYNRAGVERVMGFCTEDEAKHFPPGPTRGGKGDGRFRHPAAEILAGGERGRADSRLKARINDGRKIWKLSPMDLKSDGRWYDYSRARDDCSRRRTHPGRLGSSYARTINAAPGAMSTHILRQIPYESLPQEKVKLPERQKPHGYVEPHYDYRYVPELPWQAQPETD